MFVIIILLIAIIFITVGWAAGINYIYMQHYKLALDVKRSLNEDGAV